MAFISQESVLEVKRAIDITEVVRSYLPTLKKAGSNYKALCPFHEEKTPSFNVHPEKGIYKCFGCGKAGDAISFVMEMDKVDYPEAMRVLAQRAGIELRFTGGGPSTGPRKDDVYRVNEWAAGVYRKLLATDAGAAARAYLGKRGVTSEIEEQFGLGFSLNEWEGLISRARKAGFDERLMVAAGLAIERDGGQGCYDRFRGRLMFPIADARGKVIGFGARALGDEEPKYINTSETAVFSKGRTLYGLHLQKEALEESKTIHIVEGYFDVILPYQSGVRGIVATLGTALTRDHLKVLRRYVEKVVLVFDGDAAGQEANLRGLELLLGENMDLFVADLPVDEDPDDVVVRHGADALRDRLAKRREIFDFLVNALEKRHGGETSAARARVIDEILERVRQVEPVRAEVFVKRLAERFRMDERALRAGLRRGTVAVTGAPAPSEVEGPSLEEAAGRNLLRVLVVRPELAAEVRSSVPLDRFPGTLARAVAEIAYAHPELSGGDLLALVTDTAQRQLVAGLLEGELEPRKAKRVLEECVQFIGRQAVGDLRAHLKAAKTAEEKDRLLSELMKRPDLPGSLPRP